MDDKTLEALKGSIAKWEAIVAGTGVDRGVENCPLCQMFCANDDEDADCRGCPVMRETGRSDCNGSPYMEWAELAPDSFPLHEPTVCRRLPPEGTPGRRKVLAAAQAELDFLKSLLPGSSAAIAKATGDQ